MCNMPNLKRVGPAALAGLENLEKLHMSFNPLLTEIHPKALARPDDIGETYNWPLVKEVRAFVDIIEMKPKSRVVSGTK
jgi:hypothetical protein